MSKKCSKCGMFLCSHQSVCGVCATKYVGAHSVVVRRRPVPQQNAGNQCFNDDHFIDSIAVELKKDISYLVELGIKLDKGTLATQTGGTAWAGFEAVTGDWLSALVVGGASLLAGGLASGYKRIKVAEVRQKWLDRLSDLNQDQLAYLMAGLQQQYPLLVRRFQNLLQAGE